MYTDRSYRRLTHQPRRTMTAIARAATPSDTGYKLALAATVTCLLLLATAQHLLLSAAV